MQSFHVQVMLYRIAAVSRTCVRREPVEVSCSVYVFCPIAEKIGDEEQPDLELALP